MKNIKSKHPIVFSIFLIYIYIYIWEKLTVAQRTFVNGLFLEIFYGKKKIFLDSFLYLP